MILFEELKCSIVFRIGISHVLVGWMLLQIVNLVEEFL